MRQTVTIRLETKMKRQLMDVAKKAKLPMSYLVETAVERFIADVGKELARIRGGVKK